MSEQRKAIIIGGGPAGLVAALFLHARTNITCKVYEVRPQPTTLGGAVGIAPNGLLLLHRLGLYDNLIARGCPLPDLVVHSLQGKSLGQQDIGLGAGEQSGFSHLRIKRTELLDVLLEAVDKAGIPVSYNMHLTSISEVDKAVKATFADGTVEAADFLLGCDGIHSTVRKLYIDPSETPTYTGIAALGSIIPTSQLPDPSVLEPQGLHITMTQEGMFMAMPCTASKDEVYWSFAQETPLPESGDTRDGWEVRIKEEVEGFKSELLGFLKDAGGEWGAMMRRIVELTSVVKFYPIHQLPLGGAWCKGRCILLGDAAHAMPPHASQGVSMALEDASLLSRLLEDSSRPIQDVCSKYDQVRRPRVEEIARRSLENSDPMRKTGPWGLWLKEIGIWIYLRCHGDLISDKEQLIYDVDQVEL